jgi:hypothetical protein
MQRLEGHQLYSHPAQRQLSRVDVFTDYKSSTSGHVTASYTLASSEADPRPRPSLLTVPYRQPTPLLSVLQPYHKYSTIKE